MTNWILNTILDSYSAGGHANVPSVGVTMTVECFPQLSVVDDHDDDRQKKIGALFAMSAHKECAVVDHVYVQLVRVLAEPPGKPLTKIGGFAKIIFRRPCLAERGT